MEGVKRMIPGVEGQVEGVRMKWWVMSDHGD